MAWFFSDTGVAVGVETGMGTYITGLGVDIGSAIRTTGGSGYLVITSTSAEAARRGRGATTVGLRFFSNRLPIVYYYPRCV
jgi:hypothetical protein